MLDSLRDATKSWVATIFIALLVMSFAVWGIQDFLGAAPTTDIAKVAGTPISRERFERHYRDELRRIEQRTGQSIADRQARELGLDRQALTNLIDQIAMERVAVDLGLNVSQRSVLGYLKSIPNATDATGRINTQWLQFVLQESQMTEAQLLDTIRGGLLRDQVTNTILTGLNLPDGLASALNYARRERRTVEYLKLDPAILGNVPDLDEAGLKKYYADNGIRFRRPEYRAVSLLVLSPTELAKTATVSEDEIKRIYEAAKATYVVPEERKFEQIRFKDEAAARDGAERLARGEDFEAVALLQGMKTGETKIGTAKAGDSTIPRQAFETAVNVPTAPIKGPFGWIILRATEITPGSSKTLEDVRTEIRDRLAQDQAKTRIIELTREIEEALGAGTSLEEAAGKAKLTLRSIPAINAQGKGLQDEVIDGLPQDSEFLRLVQEGETGRDSEFLFAKDGSYYLYRVDKVIPAS
ncbi:MAG TPA: hypothetical protein DCL54_02280, partial [Alphaproteobacteria bacterium]|nr:hypothetical protein [Alphaproteobacteria bacterium]